MTTTNSNSHILTETTCALKDVPKILPTRPCFQTVWRWSNRGVRGCKLETYKVGAVLLTSHEAVHRFLEAQQK